MNPQHKLLITGASGFTGQHACKHFVNAGFDVTAIINNNAYENDDVHIERCDLTNKDEVNNLIKKVNPHYLLHLAGQNHVGQSWIDPIFSLEANSLSTAYLIDALRQEYPACKIVVAGSALQFNPANMSTLTHPYSLSKTLQVLIAQSWGVLYNMHIVIAKPSNLIGPGYSNGVCSIFAKKVADMENNKAEKVLEVNNPNVQRDFIDVRDAVSAYETLLLRGESGEIYDIASGKNHSLKDILNRLESLTTVKFELKSQSNEILERKAEIIPIKLMELGWKPSFSFESSLLDILNFYRGNLK
ncbi:NAD-dependent epimerase/dehydratase family protein [Bacillus sp. 7884-1]|uniref:NAD-dependent epimerase/dehydratase family protein n=1 Tax=Bacillus sp. 7884-1 TaxID=2021693 RepID=UPI000BA707AA|nr:NAD-dependent epimerase/dehydratase family protein [Bacillus sp. 7884-1]PAE44089.1 UDP-2-acetamido-2,6-dideoxy-hexulose 4-reductase [Bacillus sp. 7884-1]